MKPRVKIYQRSHNLCNRRRNLIILKRLRIKKVFRIYRSQRRYHDDQLIDHLLQTWDYNNNEPVSPFSDCLHSQLDQEMALDLPPSYAEVCPDRSSKIETSNSLESSEESENPYDEIPSGDSSGSEQIGTSFLSTRGDTVRNQTV